VPLPFVSGLLVLDAEGARVAVKYFDPTILGGAIAAANTAPGAAAVTPAPAVGSAAAAKAQEAQLKAELAFEKKVFAKTARNQRQDGYDTIPEVMLLDNGVVLVYKVIADLVFYVAGKADENELILQSVLQALDETMHNLLKGQVAKKTVVENLDLLLLAIDEIIDEGLILETDSQIVVGRVCMVGQGADGGNPGKDVPLSEQSFTQALQTARDQLVRSFR